ncbi:MAG: hypothetical protein R3E96_03440 [Planctomycetota bacterium]
MHSRLRLRAALRRLRTVGRELRVPEPDIDRTIELARRAGP